MTASPVRAGVGARDPGVGARVPTKATARMHREVSALLTITHRLGLRLKYAQKQTSVEVLPDETWLETYKQYSTTLKWCLAEERQRRAAKVEADQDGEPMSDAEVQAELRAIALEGMSEDDLRAELERRTAAAVPEPIDVEAP